MKWWVLLVLGCGGKDPADSSAPPAALNDSAGNDSAEAQPDDSGEGSTVFHAIEEVAALRVPDVTGVRDARVHPTHGRAYLLTEAGTSIRIVSQTWVHPTGTYCVSGSVDEEGICRGGVEVSPGRIDSPQVTERMCTGDAADELILVKETGRRLEVIDVGDAGEEAYSLHTAVRRPQLPPQLSASGSYRGPCAVLAEGEVALTSGEHRAIAVVSTAAESTVLRSQLLQFEPGALAASDDSIVLLDATRNRVIRLAKDSLEETGDWPLSRSGRSLAVDPSGTIWAGLEAGRVVRISAAGEVKQIQLDGAVEDLVAVDRLAWALVRQADDVRLVLLGLDGVQDERVIDPGAESLVDPGPSGDVAVVASPDAEGGVPITVFRARPDVDALPPLHVFLFTTIEEPSSANIGQPCEGDTGSFEKELNLIRANAAALDELGVPVALAISDNFAQKAEECGETSIFSELADYGFVLGVLLHNRPCYNCTDGNNAANPDHCDRSHPHWIQPTSPQACFPDDPDYCTAGDWECYRSHMNPRIDRVQRNLPGGGAFIAGADRHRMWNHDWIRLYREAGFDLTMFAASWAYAGVDADDPRGKDPAPWANRDRTVPWALGDVDHWTQDAPLSDLVYLPGINSSTVKVAEQQATGLNMIDFFSHAGLLAYRTNDFEVSYQWLRSAVNHRRPNKVNSWYFHIHDIGTLNLRDRHGEPVMIDEDGEDGPEPAVSAESLLQAHLDRIHDRYVTEGSVVWTDPVSIRRLLD